MTIKGKEAVWLVCFVAALCLAVPMAGCVLPYSAVNEHTAPPAVDTQAPDKSEGVVTGLSKERKEEIEAAWLAAYGTPLIWQKLDDRACLGVREYGTEGEVTVLFEPSELCVCTVIEVAGSRFAYSAGFVLRVYAEGTFYSLQEAWAQNIISARQIAAAAAFHQQWEEQAKS